MRFSELKIGEVFVVGKRKNHIHKNGTIWVKVNLDTHNSTEVGGKLNQKFKDTQVVTKYEIS